MSRWNLFVWTILLLATTLRAEVKPSGLFSENAVLQQQMEVPIWGTAADGETVTVEIAGQSAQTVAKDGRWLVRLPSMQAGGPHTLIIRGPSNTVTIKNVLIGEVWLISGQSNMGFGIGELKNYKEIEAASDDPLLRYFWVPYKQTAEPQPDVEGGRWGQANPYNTHMMSAVGYYFARALRQSRKVPIGIISSCMGGTYADTWIPRQELEADPLFHKAFDRWQTRVKQHQEAQAKYEADKSKWEQESAKAKAAGQEPPKAPTAPPDVNADRRNLPSAQYNGMIAPLFPYGIRGVAWYQGENDSDDAWRYRTITLPTLIRTWRAGFGHDFPFLIVQLPAYYHIVTEPVECGWAEMRESQLRVAQAVPNSACVIALDCGDENEPTNLHPPKKAPIGERLALAARALAYGEDVEYSGPVFKSARVEGDKMIVDFTHLGGGLEARGELRGFTLAGADRKFVNAQAEIRGDQVVVWSDHIKEPVAVRYAWWNNPPVTLWSKAGLPASPFRSDDFPMITKPR